MNFVGLEGNKSKVFAFVALQFAVVNAFLFSSPVVLDRALDDVFDIAFNSYYPRTVKAKRRCRMMTDRAAYSAHCALFPGVECADETVAQSF